MKQRINVCGLLATLALRVGWAWAGEGVVALQTADPSCPDESGDIYVDCGNGTVTDNRTGLVWLADAGCLLGAQDWSTAMEFVAGLSDQPENTSGGLQDCGLSDGSSPGDWRLPSIGEWDAMVADAVALGCVDGQSGGPSITTDDGTSCWNTCVVFPHCSFSNVELSAYWSATNATNPVSAFYMDLTDGADILIDKTVNIFVWPVRGGQ